MTQRSVNSTVGNVFVARRRVVATKGKTCLLFVFMMEEATAARLSESPDAHPPVSAPESALRGWLSEVFLPALVSNEDAKLLKRLGEKAIVVDPIHGRSPGGAVTADAVTKLGQWLRARGATWTEARVTNGKDRDVTEGDLTFADGTVVPCAVVSERKRAREVEVKVYFTASDLPEPSGTEVPAAAEVFVNEVAARILEWCRTGEAVSTAALFERHGIIRIGGKEIRRDSVDFAPAVATLAGLVLAPTGSAEDGRVFALQGVVTGEPDANASSSTELSLRFGPVVFVFERGETGLLRALRVYGRLG